MSDHPNRGQCFRDVLVVPYQSLLDLLWGGDLHRGGPIWPEWDRQEAARHCRRGRVADTRPDDPSGPVESAGPLAWGGGIVGMFGHQVADFSMRLLATTEAWPETPIAFAPEPGSGWATVDEAPTYFGAILEWFGISPERVRIITAPTRVSELCVMPQAEQLMGPGPSEATLDALDAHARRRLGDQPAGDGRPLYVSRAAMEARFAGEAYLERALVDAGIGVMRPEAVPLHEQLDRYRSAEHIVFAEGSALHALQLLGRIPAQLTVLVRREGQTLAEPNLRPRVHGLEYVDTTVGVLHGLSPSGYPAKGRGLSVFDEERLMAALRRQGLDLGRTWDRQAFRTARDRDILEWLDWQASQPERHGLGSVDHILEGLDELGLPELVDQAAVHLAPLRRDSEAVRPGGADTTRPPLLYLDFPRAAGRGVVEALESAYPAEARVRVGDRGLADVLADPAEPPMLVTGNIDYGRHERLGQEPRYVTVLRQPIGRLVSLHRERYPAGSGGPDLEEWVFGRCSIEADNAYVRAISGRSGVPFGECTQAMLEEALAHIEADFAAVLDVRHPTRIRAVLSELTGTTLPPVSVAEVEAESGLLATVEPALKKRLRQLNRFDLELYSQLGTRLSAS